MNTVAKRVPSKSRTSKGGQGVSGGICGKGQSGRSLALLGSVHGLATYGVINEGNGQRVHADIAFYENHKTVGRKGGNVTQHTAGLFVSISQKNHSRANLF